MDGVLPFLLRTLPPALEPLTDLALDLRWTWSHASDELWKTLDPETWELTQNPWLILQSISQQRLEQLAGDPKVKSELERLVKARKDYIDQPGWCRAAYPEEVLGTTAYFSMEYGIGEALPLYAGGLGILAGDYLKTASDLNVPLVGVGLLYQEGYFRQILNEYGWQLEAYPDNDPLSLPISPVLDASGGWLKITLELPGRTLLLRVWQARVGRVTLYLLDSNDPLNSSTDRGIASVLYDENREIRLIQEMVLGIGGWRMLKALGVNVDLCHLNEGHAAFVVLERACDFMQQSGQPFEVALCATRAGNVFTTHTPVAAGFDTFSASLVSRYLRSYASPLGISMEQLLALGRGTNGATDSFNMAALAMRGSIIVNGVSRLHGKVSRRIFQSLYPRWPEHDVPVTHITNGVHVPSWDSKWADKLWTQTAGEACWRGAPGSLEKLTDAIQRLSDRDLWEFRARERKELVSYVRYRLERQFKQHGSEPEAIAGAMHVLDPDILTVGFARRFTGYKRPNLLLHDPERLKRIITHSERPIQIIAAGKAHPEDEEGKHLIQQFIQFASQTEVRHRVVFLEDYDIVLAQQLVQGIDLWVNTPRRHWEACGTSGMKVLVNGGLNFSELDGWWAEAYSPGAGWAIGDRQEHEEPGWDAQEAGQLYDTLEQKIIPEFYERNAEGIPESWVYCVRLSMSQLTPRFSTNRMVKEYVENIYVPATSKFRSRSADGARLARELNAWQRKIEQNWSQLHFGKLQVQRKDDQWLFEVPVYLGELEPAYIRAEIYADPVDEKDAVREPMTQSDRLPGTVSGYMYRGAVKTERPEEDFTIRIIPFHPSAFVPLEEAHILWQR